MNYMPRPTSEMKKLIAPRGLYHCTVIEEEEATNSQGEYIKIKLKTTVENIDYIITDFLSNGEYSARKLYAYCLSSGRDYMSGNLTRLKGDKVWAIVDIKEKSGVDKETGRTFTYKVNHVKTYLTSVEVHSFKEQEASSPAIKEEEKDFFNEGGDDIPF